MATHGPMRGDGDWLYRDVPDPLGSLYGHFAARDRTAGRRWANQRQRRSLILATARQLMAEQDFSQVHVEHVASRCGVSVQTIYNLVGNRSEMIGASAEEWVFAIAEVARADAEARDLNEVFTLLTIFWSSAIIRADYVRSASRTSIADIGELRLRFHRAGVEVFRDQLMRIAAGDGLRDHVNIPSMARQLALNANVAISNWSIYGRTVAEFRDDLLNGPGLMLMGALQGAELVRLERTLDAMRRTASPAPPATLM